MHDNFFSTFIILFLIIVCTIIILTDKPPHSINHYVAESKAIATSDINVMQDSNAPAAMINFFKFDQKKGKEVLIFQIHEDGMYVNHNYPIQYVMRHVIDSIDQLSGRNNVRSYDYNVYLDSNQER